MDKRTRELSNTLLHDRSETERRIAARRLGMLGDTDAIPILRRVEQDANQTVNIRLAASNALRKLQATKENPQETSWGEANKEMSLNAITLSVEYVLDLVVAAQKRYIEPDELPFESIRSNCKEILRHVRKLRG